MIVLGIETSCDDTSLALYSEERGIIAECTAAQLVHGRYGGVVPEIASRVHIKTVLPVFRNVTGGIRGSDIGGVGVSNGPGLIGSLLVGAGFAKSLAYGLGVPVVGVHHIESHIFANELGGTPLAMPCVVLVASGGHTCLYLVRRVGVYELLGTTRDDAAGEAFDKIAKLLGLGYPGGPAIQKAAAHGDPAGVQFPRAMMIKDNFDFSFSGLKTAVRIHVERLASIDEQAVADIAASAQEAIVDALVRKTIACANAAGVRHLYCAGGVAANRLLRERFGHACAAEHIEFHAPLVRYCTDNGAMVACAAAKHLAQGRNDGIGLDVFARGSLRSWRA